MAQTARAHHARGKARDAAHAVARDRRNGLKAVPKLSDDEHALRFAECRALGHSWQHVGLAEEGATWRWGSVGYVSVCTHCTTRRTRYYTRSGAYGGRPKYERPDGYSRRGEDRLSMAEWRATWATTLGLK